MSSSRLKQGLQDFESSKKLQSHQADAGLLKANAQLTEEITLLRLRVLELEQAANTDPLIPIFNRRALLREIEKAQSAADRYKIVSTLIFFDLNDFKRVNDKYGHRIGDNLLLKIGNVLKSSVRDCDMVARLGGDEFGVLLFKTDPEIAKIKAAALSCRIADQHVLFPGTRVSVTAAWGVASCDPNKAVEQILDRADRSMYLDKYQKI